jgi:cation transport ATPase
MRTIDVVLFDKTGTLTEGRHAVTGAAVVPGVSEAELLALAAAAEADSEHPVARAVVDGSEITVGGPNMLRELGVEIPAEIAGTTGEWSGRGAGVLHVLREVGIAIGAGTDVAMESAGVVLAGNDPRAVLSMIDLSRASYRKAVQNLGWAAGYNVVAVPLAAGALAPAGIVLSPAVGAVLMSLSTIVVAFNAQLLRRIDLDPARLAPAAAAEPAVRAHRSPTPRR